MESTTSWSAREEATLSVSLHHEKIMVLLGKLKECTSKNVDTRSKARSLLFAVENCILFAHLELWWSLLRPINIVQKKLQQLGLNIKEAAEEIETLSCFLGNDEEMVKLIAKSIEKAQQWSTLLWVSFSQENQKERKKSWWRRSYRCWTVNGGS